MNNPNSKKHKASHGGYKSKPTKTQVQASLDFWKCDFFFKLDFPTESNREMVFIKATSGEGKPRLGTQLKLNF